MDPNTSAAIARAQVALDNPVPNGEVDGHNVNKCPLVEGDLALIMAELKKDSGDDKKAMEEIEHLQREVARLEGELEEAEEEIEELEAALVVARAEERVEERAKPKPMPPPQGKPRSGGH